MSRDRYAVSVPKCAFSGRLLFPGDPVVVGPDGAHFADESAQALAALSGSLEECLPLLSSWLVRPDEVPDERVDPVLQEVIHGALRSIWEEMKLTMTRTAYSPVFFEGEDFTVRIFDRNLERVALREGFVAQMGAMQQAVQAAVPSSAGTASRRATS